MDTFDLFYHKHLTTEEVEGKYSNSAIDHGGETWLGLSSIFLDEIKEKKPPTRARAKEITYEYFWKKARCDEMYPKAAWMVCDAVFNHNFRGAVRFIQRACGAKSDGIIGTQTIKAINNYNRDRFHANYLRLRIAYYRTVINKDSTQMGNMVGWMMRLHYLNKHILDNGLYEKNTDFLIARIDTGNKLMLDNSTS